MPKEGGPLPSAARSVGEGAIDYAAASGGKGAACLFVNACCSLRSLRLNKQASLP